jgi:hypothetical protein
VIVLPADSERERDVWSTLLDIADREQRWTVVGARMVELHLVERGHPDELAMELRAREHLWLRRRAEMNEVAADCWIGVAPTDIQKGLAALRILARVSSPSA